jgi:hypothetical protein
MGTAFRTAIRAFLILGLVGGGVAFAASKLRTDPGGFICPPTNLVGAAAANAKVTCPEGYASVAVENESSTAVHFCGSNANDGGVGAISSGGFTTAANVTTACPKRCTTCTAGSVYAPEIEGPGQLYCISAGADAGVTVSVTCAK